MFSLTLKSKIAFENAKKKKMGTFQPFEMAKNNLPFLGSS